MTSSNINNNFFNSKYSSEYSHLKTFLISTYIITKQMAQIPIDWYCSLTHEVMTDPVTASDGYTYERKSIEEWLKTHDSSPVTKAGLKSKDLVSNLALKSTIDNLLPEYLKNGGVSKLSEEQIEGR